MGLYIEGIRLPKKGRYTSYTVYSDGRVVYKFGGSPAGQAIEVPAHGRLGDLDALRQDWLENGENECVYDTNAFLGSLDDAPTIIPAEGDT